MTFSTGYLQIVDGDLDDLLAALRRHDKADADRLLARWATSETQIDWNDEACQNIDWPLLHLDHDLSAWVYREAADHVAGGRFEHALCLVEAYRRPLKPADMIARITLPNEARQ